MKSGLAVTALALALVGAAVGGCGSSDGSLVGYAPEGQPSDAILLLDVQPVDPDDPNDPLDSVDSSQVNVLGTIYDHSAVNGYRLYVDPGDEGFRPAADYISAPTKSYITGYNVYTIRATVLSPTGFNDFVGRGARNGQETSAAPVTNTAVLPPVPAPIDLARRINLTLAAPLDSAETDSTPTLVWNAVPGAARYLLRITGRNGVNYLAFTTSTTHTVEVDPAILINDIPMRPGFLYRWDVQAIDASGRIIAATGQPRAILIIRP